MNIAEIATELVSEPFRAPSREDSAVIIPTCNARKYWPQLHAALTQQRIAPEQVLIIDSSSSDNTQQLALQAGYRLITIPRTQFGHGATRQVASQQVTWAHTLIYLTQDAIPCGDRPFETLLQIFRDPTIGAAYGRQLPRENASAIERHARLFNYPPSSYVRDSSSRLQFGFRAAFFSNSFAAYRRSALEQVGGFLGDALVSEDVSVAARMLLRGWKIAYCAEAAVTHSHPLSIRHEFSRYFDIAVQHRREQWILDTFGNVGNQGREFVRSELRYLLRNDIMQIPHAAVITVDKWIGYQLGLREKFLPLWFKRALSGQPAFWQKNRHGRYAYSSSDHSNELLGA